MNFDKKSIKTVRELLQPKYGNLFEKVSSILFKADLQDINYETNTDEYDSEVGTILPRLNEAKTVFDVQQIIFEEFNAWFSEAGTVNDYKVVAEKIWAEWVLFVQKYNSFEL